MGKFRLGAGSGIAVSGYGNCRTGVHGVLVSDETLFTQSGGELQFCLAHLRCVFERNTARRIGDGQHRGWRYASRDRVVSGSRQQTRVIRACMISSKTTRQTPQEVYHGTTDALSIHCEHGCGPG